MSCKSCILEVSQWGKDGIWRKSQIYSEDLQAVDHTGNPTSAFSEAQVCVIFMSATKIRNCPHACQNEFLKAFSMPEKWPSISWENSNGYFGCYTTRQSGIVTGFNTCVSFETKEVRANLDYTWTKLNIFTRWVSSTNQTFLLLSDAVPSLQKTVLQSLLNPIISQLEIPFWPYPHLLEILACLQETAVWSIRDQVRTIEMAYNPGIAPQTEFREMHDIARHAIHVGESIDVSVQNITAIMVQSDRFIKSKQSGPDSYFGVDEDIHNQIEFFRSYIANLRHRETSNEKRLQNEIQLAFNSVAQANAGISVEIGRAAQSDSSAMKTIAFVTLAFLPPTFISSIFSMSFFQASGDNGWNMSNKFWIYWAFAIPTTIATVVVWQYWQKTVFSSNHQKTPADRKKRVFSMA